MQQRCCRKVYRFRMQPTKAQEEAMLRQAGACRFIWNWALARRKEQYAKDGTTLNAVALSRELTTLKRSEGMGWLAEVTRDPLGETLRDLDRAFANFFAKRARHPRFKSKKREAPRFRCHELVRLSAGKVFVPKVGWVRVRQSQPVDLPTKSATFKRDVAGRWFVTLVAEFELPDAALPEPDPAKIVGIDLGLKDFAVLSTGERVPAPKFFRAAQRKLRLAQQHLARCKPGSKRRAKARARVARIQAKTANRRSDFLHKLTTDLVRSHDGLCIEDLCVRGLARTKLAKSVTDASMGEFRRQLTYKPAWNRRHLAVVDRWFPSSKLHLACGEVNTALTLDDRTWVCGCGAVIDRDLNAAINIRDEGLRMLAGGHPESQNARGRLVSPATAGEAG